MGFGAFARAESPAGPPPGGNAPQGQYGGQGGGQNADRQRGVGVFNDGIFNVDSGSNAPSGPPPVSAGGRYMGDAPDYNTEQQAAWKRACARFRNTDARQYRDCYLQEKAKNQEQVRQSFERVERGQAGIFRNVSPGSALDAPPSRERLPSGERGIGLDTLLNDAERDNRESAKENFD